MALPLLQIKDLQVDFETEIGKVTAISNISYHNPQTLSLYQGAEIGYHADDGVTLSPHLVPTQPSMGAAVPAQALGER